MFQQPRPPQAGFTLIELMIVIAILAILLAIAVPSYQAYNIRARVSEGYNVAAPAKAAIAELCHTAPNADITAETPFAYTTGPDTLVDTITIGGDCTTPQISVVTKNTGATVNPTFQLTGTAISSGISWVCNLTAGLPQHLPTNCRT